MVYTSGGLIQASDYNTLAALINNVFGIGSGDSGYGGLSINTGINNLPTINIGDIIQSFTSVPGSPDEWKNLRNAFFDCALHQNTTLIDPLPSDTLLDDGDIITFFNTLNSTNNSTLLFNNRFNVNAIHLALSTTLTDIRVSPWSSFVRHEFTVDFGNSDNARHFFNTGGELRISASRVGGSATTQNTEWTNLLSANSPFIFNRLDYFSLTSTFSVYQTVSSGGAYTANNWSIRARRDDAVGPNGGNGSIIRFQSDFLDGHTNVFFDSIDGTLTSTIEQLKSVGIFPKPTPIFTTTVPISSGS